MNRRLTTLACCLVATAALTAAVPKKNDFNGDGKSDILYTKASTSAVWEDQMFNSSRTASALVHLPASKNFVMVATGDVNLDGKADIFWRNTVTGDVWLQIMDGLSVVTTTKIATEPNLDWQIVLASDFNGDGTADLLWRNALTGALYMQFLGTTGTPLATSKLFYTEANTDWRPVAAKAQNLFWKNDATGAVYLMTLGLDASVSPTSKIIHTEPDLAWKIVAADDFNNDGLTDLLWWHSTTGQVYLQNFSADFSTKTGKVIWTESTIDWNIVAVGDYNGDGIADILWAKTNSSGGTGQFFQMFMDSIAPGSVNVNDSSAMSAAAGWTVASGITSVALAPPTHTAPTLAASDTNSDVWAFVPADAHPVAPAVAIPASKVYVTGSTVYTLNDTVLGPVKSSLGVTWEAWKTDGSLLLTGATTPVSPLSSATASAVTFNSPVVADYLVKAISVADPTKVASRIVSAVASPGVTGLVASPINISSGGTSTLTYSYPSNQFPTLTSDTDPTLKVDLSKVSTNVTTSGVVTGTIAVSPTATSTYTVTIKNLAGKASTATGVVTVGAQNASLDCTITTVSPLNAGVYLTENVVYQASVPATTTPGVVYTWTIQGGTILSGLGTNQITFSPNAKTVTNTSVVLNARKDLVSQYNTASATYTIAPAVTKADAILVTDGTNTQTDYLLASTASQTAEVVTPVAGMKYNWTVTGTGALVYTGGDQHKITFTPAATGTVGISVVATNLAMTNSLPTATSRIIVADPSTLTVTGSTYVTPTVTGAATASVPDAGPGATYTWTWTPVGGTGTAFLPGVVTNQRTITYGITAGTAVNSSTGTLSCAITNGAGTSATKSKTVTVTVIPAVPTGFSVSNALVTATFTGYTATISNSMGTVTPPFDATSVSFTWVPTNASITAGQGTNSITYTPTAAGEVSFTVKATNVAGVDSATSLNTHQAAPYLITAFAPPVINTFTTSTAAITNDGVASKAAFALDFTGGTGTLLDSVGSTAIAGIPAGTTSKTWNTYSGGLAENAKGAPHIITLRVTNGAADFVSKTVTVDVVPAPVVLVSLTKSANPTKLGDPVTLTPAYALNATDGGTIMTITPGPVNFLAGTETVAAANALSTATAAYTVIPTLSAATFNVTITNRAGTAITGGTATFTLPTVSISAYTYTNTTVNHGTAAQLPSTITVVNAADVSCTYTILTAVDSVTSADVKATLGGSIVASTGAYTPTASVPANPVTVTLKATSNADPSKSLTRVIIVN